MIKLMSGTTINEEEIKEISEDRVIFKDRRVLRLTSQEYEELIRKMTENKKFKHLILQTIPDLVADFLYYDRKEDEDLPPGIIEETIKRGDITIEDIVQEFREQLKNNL